MPINLVKGQRISLEKTAGHKLNSVKMGVGWDPTAEGEEVDLDGSCLLLGADKKMKEAVWFGTLGTKNGSVVHHGDNLTGEGDGDDEEITVNLTDISEDVHYLVFTVTSYSGHRFTRVQNAFCRVLDDAEKEVCRFELSEMEDKTAMIIATIYRNQGEWKFRAMGEFAMGATVMDIVGIVQSLV